VCGDLSFAICKWGSRRRNDWEEPHRGAGLPAISLATSASFRRFSTKFGIGGAFIWRGTTERDHHGHFLWQSPDGTVLPTYRFGPGGYCTLAFRVRDVFAPEKPLDVEEAIGRLADYTRFEAGRSALSPILLFDGADHLEIEPRMTEIIAGANERLATEGIRIIASDLDAYQAEMARERSGIDRRIVGELRETGREPHAVDEQWLIAGCYSSRIHLKQRNAACEDELCLWAEPFSTFASEVLSRPYPLSYLNLAWKHLLENHPHDSMCGCSIDQVHQDMIYRFDQSIGISSRLTEQALRAITMAAAPKPDVAGSLVIGVFNATAEAIDEPVDLEFCCRRIGRRNSRNFSGLRKSSRSSCAERAARKFRISLFISGGTRRDSVRADISFRPLNAAQGERVRQVECSAFRLHDDRRRTVRRTHALSGFAGDFAPNDLKTSFCGSLSTPWHACGGG